MFSMTVTTSLIILCAALRLSAIRAILPSAVVSPTVEPGLGVP